MKTQIKLLLLTLVLAGSAHADITDLTPGGTAIDYGPPAVVQINGFYDSAAFGYFDNGPNSEIFLNGWVSSFGILNGGQYFFTDLFNQPTPLPTANVWWNFGNSGYWLLYIDVFGRDRTTGADLANLYQVTHQSVFSEEDFVVTLDGQMEINSIGFYGRNPALPIPDSGRTVSLFGFALLCLAAYYAMNRDAPHHTRVAGHRHRQI